jgi:hypothetical protein
MISSKPGGSKFDFYPVRWPWKRDSDSTASYAVYFRSLFPACDFDTAKPRWVELKESTLASSGLRRNKG